MHFQLNHCLNMPARVRSLPIRAYDADALINKLMDHGVTPVIPTKAGRRDKRECVLHSIASAISSSVSSTRLSTSAASQRATTNWRETISMVIILLN